MGFMAPGLGFASTAGAFIGGAAKQASVNMETASAQAANDEKIWIAKFASGLQDYEKEEKNRQTEAGVYQTALNSLGGNARAADDVVRTWRANPKVDITELIKNTKVSSPDIKPEEGYSSQTQSELGNSLRRKYDILGNVRSGMRPQSQKMFPMPNAPTQYALGGAVDDPRHPNSIFPFSNATEPSQFDTPLEQPEMQPGQADLSGTTMIAPESEYQVADAASGNYNGIGGGAPKGAALREMLKPEQFSSPQAYKDYINSYNKNPMTPNLDGLRVDKPSANKLDPSYGPAVIEFQKHFSYMTPEDRAAASKSIQRARETGDPSEIRWDLQPSQTDIDTQAALKAAGTEASKKYVDDLQKRGSLVSANRSMLLASDEMIKSITDPTNPIKASAMQPFLDELNRGFSSAGVDLTKLGLPANPVEQVNFFKKLINDMTFQQISQYHLGRWTNYEVGLLKKKLPSMDTDPNSMLKIALLFKTSADRELRTYQKENEVAYGANGEHLFMPKDLGKAKKYGIDVETTEGGKAPWEDVTSWANPTKKDEETYAKLAPGMWIQDRSSGAMIQKGGGIIPSATGKPD